MSEPMVFILRLALLDNVDATFIDNDDVTCGLALSHQHWVALGSPTKVRIEVAER